MHQPQAPLVAKSLSTSYIKRQVDQKGIWIASTILLLWAVSTVHNLFYYSIDWFSPLPYLLFLAQTHLFTGMFITAHDAMHGTVSLHAKTNRLIGSLCLFLFAFNSYESLLSKHHAHHDHVATHHDPDYHPSNEEHRFGSWYWGFLKEHVRWKQILWNALLFNVLIWVSPIENVVFLYILPAILSTTQLFYFGTYLPHRGEHESNNTHKARTQKRNHLWAFVSCYFFGYHYEHHDLPNTPWWLLWKTKP